MQKAGDEQYALLPGDGFTTLAPGDYFIAVMGEGQNPPGAGSYGAGDSQGALVSLGSLPVTALGVPDEGGISVPVSLAAGQVQLFSFNHVPWSTLELRLDDRVGDPIVCLMPGTQPPAVFRTGVGGYLYGHDGGQAPGGSLLRRDDPAVISVPAAAPGPYRVAVYASATGNATATLTLQPRMFHPLKYDAALPIPGSHTDSRQILNGQRIPYSVDIPNLATVIPTDGATVPQPVPVLGWMLRVTESQGDTTLRVYRDWADTSSASMVSSLKNAVVISRPWLEAGRTWHAEVEGRGLTHYTIVSEAVRLKRPVWIMPTAFNQSFGDSGLDAGGNPLPGDQGIDIAQDEWHFYAIDVPPGNSGLLRTQLEAISGNPDLYIREDGVPTLDHKSNGAGGADLVHRKLTDTATEYGNWVPVDKTERRLRPGRWFLAVNAASGSNVRYRLRVSTGDVTAVPLTLAAQSGQFVIGRDWKYYQFDVPLEAPSDWTLTFSQQVGDVVMYLRDTVPPGNYSDTGSGFIRHWWSDQKNQGPYGTQAGYDPPGGYAFTTPPLRPGAKYFVGFRGVNDGTFTFSASAGAAIVPAPVLNWETGSVNVASVAPGGALLYRIPVPADAHRLKWSAVHNSSFGIRLEQGTLTQSAGPQHYSFTGAANSSLNQKLLPAQWPWQPGQDYYLRITNNGAVGAPFQLTMSGKTVLNDDEDHDGLPDVWEEQNFPPNGNAAPQADGDSDGVSNLLEYAFGLDPHDPNDGVNATPLVDFAGGDPNNPLTITFCVPDPPPALVRFDVEGANTLAGPWSVIASHQPADPWTVWSGLANVVANPGPPGFLCITATDIVTPAMQSPRFLRVTVAVP